MPPGGGQGLASPPTFMNEEGFRGGFPESVLTKDEQVVLHLHPHWKALFLPVVWFVLAVAAVVVLAIFTGWGMIPMLIVSAVALVLVLLVTVWPWIKWRTTHYVF